MRALLAIAILLVTASTAHAADAVPTALPAPPDGEAEPNGTAATASAIRAGERIRADISAAGDADLYRFEARAGDRVYAATVTAASSSGTDSIIRLLDTDGTTAIERDDDDGRVLGASSIAGARIPTTGTYYLEVTGKNTQRLRPYDLWLDVRTGDPVQEAEPNDTEDAATPLGDGVVSGANAAGEKDYYALQLEAGDSVFVSLDERDGPTDAGRAGFGASGRERAFTYSGSGDGITSSMYVDTVPSAGTYYVLVDGAAGTYRLSATVVKAVKRSCRTYTITPADGAIPDQGHTTFPIDVPDAGEIDRVALALDLTHPSMVDLDATLQAPAGSEIPIFTDIGDRAPYGRMETVFDDDAAAPPLGIDLTSTVMQPEPNARLSYFSGRRAAGTWNLRLDDDVRGDTGTLTRADLILCARPEAPEDTVFSATFEDGDDGFAHTGEWERGTPATAASGNVAGLASCAGGKRCFKTDLDGTYDSNSSQDLVSPPISLAGRTGPIFASWAMWFQLENANFDHATVSVEEDGGNNPRALFTWNGKNMYEGLGIPLRTVAYGAGWDLRRADISDYAGKTIRLRFHLDSDLEFNFAGLAIDDVRVYQDAFPLDVALAGAGRVTSDPGGIDCGSTCSMNHRGEVTLTAHPDAGSGFGGFDGCSGTGLTCTLNVDRARRVTATFTKAPVGEADAYATDEDVPLRVAAPGVLGNDADGDGGELTASLVSEPEHGRVELSEDGSFVYTPDADYNGSDSFAYRASEGALESAETTVAIDVAAVDDPVPVEATPTPEPTGTPQPTATPTPQPTGTPQPTAAPVGVAEPSAPAVAEPALSQVRLAAGCVRRSSSGRARVVLTMRLAKPGPVEVRVERAVESTGRSRCWRPSPGGGRTMPALSWRAVTTTRSSPQAVAAAVHGRMRLSLRLKPGLYRLRVQAVLAAGRLSSPVYRFVRVRS